MTTRLRWVVVASVWLSQTLVASGAYAVQVDLSTFPESGLPVPNGTVLDDQWRSIGILFDANPNTVDPIKEDFGGGSATLFFDPDVFGATAVFTFVMPGTMDPAAVTHFSLRPFFNPGESAQLIGFDELGMQVAIDTITPAEIGGSSRTITMGISGLFHRVEWHTQGNPGISAEDIQFDFGNTRRAPALGSIALTLLAASLVGLATLRLRRARP